MDDKGDSLGRYPVNFKITLADRVRAAGGLPAHIRRKRRIEDLEEATLLALDELYEEALAEAGEDATRASVAFEAAARQVDLRLLNDLVDRHNRWYPIEANLPIDVATGKLTAAGELWQPLEQATCEGFIARWREARRAAER